MYSGIYGLGPLGLRIGPYVGGRAGVTVDGRRKTGPHMKTGTYILGDYRSQCIGIDTNSPVRLSSNEQDEATALLQQYCTTFVILFRTSARQS